MIRRKTKMISFRISPDEYHKLRDACMSQGVSSVSELARAAVDTILKHNGSPKPVSEQLADLRERVETLAADIEHLARNLDTGSRADAAFTFKGD